MHPAGPIPRAVAWLIDLSSSAAGHDDHADLRLFLFNAVGISLCWCWPGF
jgi:hypothetical protein